MSSLADDLTGIARKLAQAHRELGELLAAQKERSTEAWWNAQSDSVTARDREADALTVDVSTEILKLKGEVAALTVEWETIRTLIGVDKCLKD